MTAAPVPLTVGLVCSLWVTPLCRGAVSHGALQGASSVTNPALNLHAPHLHELMGGIKGPLNLDAAMAVFREVSSAAAALVQPMTVAFVGPAGSFSHQAALELVRSPHQQQLTSPDCLAWRTLFSHR